MKATACSCNWNKKLWGASWIAVQQMLIIWPSLLPRSYRRKLAHRAKCLQLSVSQLASECTSGLNGLNWVYLLLDQNKVGIVIWNIASWFQITIICCLQLGRNSLPKSNEIASLFIVISQWCKVEAKRVWTRMIEEFMPSSHENLVQLVPRHQLKKMATYCSKQEVVLFYQNLELRAKRLLSRRYLGTLKCCRKCVRNGMFFTLA